MKPEEIRKVGVVGCGIMGSGIVEVCAKAGMDVTYIEVDDERIQHGQASIDKSLARAVEKGKLDAAERDQVVGRIKGSTDLADLADCDLVIEAVTEELETKKQVFATLDEIVKPDVVLATNTSTLPIAELATQTNRPDKVIGLHFFNPPPVMKLLEVIKALTTSEETIELCRAFGERIGKTTVLAKDRAGFIVNFLLIPFLNSAVQMLDDGVATKEDIDAGVQLGLGHPMGPLTLLDLIGLDTAMHASNVLYDEFKDPIYAPPTLLKRMVAAGYLGRKSGKGFYEYGSK
ncbi:MAG TPA: 3-hydroxybutyryl-CoA dehydrogenase [Actinobacteria bacterium]|jgi:3-hydroxybutyryl-CoA dehydrogenase|nr:3-hydroxybutyryl-CoA dehydrogenase [Actinomycetota bacterium]